MQTLWQDLRYGARMLLKKPSFTLVAIITLALGIGANTAIFSVVQAALLRPLPFERPEQLVRVTADLQRMGVSDVGMSGMELFDYLDRADVFDQISGIYPINANITWVDQPERVEALLVDVNSFSLLGANARLGRIFQPEDYRSGIAEIAVISDGLWKRRYGSDPNAIGKKFRLDNDLYTIVGVMPPEFRHPGRAAGRRVAVDNQARIGADIFRDGNRVGGCVCRHSIPELFAIRRQPDRPFDVCRHHRSAGRCGHAGMLFPRAKSNPSRLYDRASI